MTSARGRRAAACASRSPESAPRRRRRSSRRPSPRARLRPSPAAAAAGGIAANEQRPLHAHGEGPPRKPTWRPIRRSRPPAWPMTSSSGAGVFSWVTGASNFADVLARTPGRVAGPGFSSGESTSVRIDIARAMARSSSGRVSRMSRSSPPLRMCSRTPLSSLQISRPTPGQHSAAGTADTAA